MRFLSNKELSDSTRKELNAIVEKSVELEMHKSKYQKLREAILNGKKIRSCKRLKKFLILRIKGF